MTFDELYNSILPLWGKQIDISDVIEIVPKKKKSPILSSSLHPAYYSSSLSHIYGEVKAKISTDNITGHLLAWCIYEHIQKNIVGWISAKNTVISFDQLSPKEIEKNFMLQLNDGDHQEEKEFFYKE